MDRLKDILLAVGILCPFVAVYLSGALVRMGRDNKQQPKNKRAKFNLALVGEALPGMFETVATLAAVFGVAFQSSDATQRFQLLGLVASAGFLAFRGGYTFLPFGVATHTKSRY
jgi:hypothetical protein